MPHRQFAVIDFNANAGNNGYTNMTMNFKLSSGKLERDARNDTSYKLTTWPKKMAEYSTRDAPLSSPSLHPSSSSSSRPFAHSSSSSSVLLPPINNNNNTNCQPEENNLNKMKISFLLN